MADILKVKTGSGPSAQWRGISAIKGEKGDTGNTGPQGPKGDTGTGVPAAGLTNQVLKKNSNTDYDFKWEYETQSSTTWGQIVGTLSNQIDLNAALNSKQATIDSSHKLDDTLVAHGQSTVNTELIDQKSQIITINSTVSGHTTDILNLQRRTHNNITSNLTNLPTAIAEQNLEKYGYTIGDYFVGESGYTYWLADMDTYYGGYSSSAIVDTHHCAVVVDSKSSSQWSSESTAPRYDLSALHTYLSDTVLENVKSDLTALFGGWSNHIISHGMLANGIGYWETVGFNYIRAMTELEVCGSRIWSGDNYQQGEAIKQLELFRKFRFNEIFGNDWYWLRSLYSSTAACILFAFGNISNTPVNNRGRTAGVILLY